MRFSPIVLLLVAILGCGSETNPGTVTDEKAAAQQKEIAEAVKKAAERSESSKIAETSSTVGDENTDATPAAERVETHEQAIAAIEKLGGKVNFDEKSLNRPVVSVDLNRTKVTDEELLHLKALTKLEYLNLDGTKVTDSGLVHLKGLTNLQTLNLDFTKVTDEGVKKLQTALPNCRIIH